MKFCRTSDRNLPSVFKQITYWIELNWYSTGYGKNTIVIYGPGGKFVREFALGDLLPAAAVNALPRSVSSIWWGQDHRFDSSGKYLILRIVSNGKMPYEADAQFREMRIELATGKIAAP